MREITKAFKSLSDKNRLRILMMLSRKPMCVCEIREVLGITVSTVSKHLSILREAGFILDEKDGKWVNYKLNTFTNDAYLQQLILMLPMWLKNDKTITSDSEKVSKADRNLICN